MVVCFNHLVDNLFGCLGSWVFAEREKIMEMACSPSTDVNGELGIADVLPVMMAQQEISPASPVNIDETPQHTLERIFGKCDAKYIQSKDGSNLLDRFKPLEDWLGDRLSFGLDPYAKATDGPIVAETVAYDRAGRRFQGVNFASQDYLSLASHPAIKRTAIEAIERVGVHSAGSAALMGLTTATLATAKLADDMEPGKNSIKLMIFCASFR